MRTSCEHCTATAYCASCWDLWNDYMHYLNTPLKRPERYYGRACFDYEGRSVHVLQIGLGTFGTFLHHDQYWLDMLLEASSKGATDELCAIGVDPVEESAGPLERIAMDEASNNRCSIMLAAVGDEELDRVSLWCLPHMARQSLREELVGRGVDTVTKAAVDKQMAYMENMSSIHSAHPDFAHSVEWVRHMSHTPMPLIEERAVPMHSFASILAHYNASSCELLLIDAEGGDCAVLRSMIQACSDGVVRSWPKVIRFETRGHADVMEQRRDTEESTIKALQQVGYLLVEAGYDATLVHGPAMALSNQLCAWADKYFTLTCNACRVTATPSSQDFAEKVGKAYTQWRDTKHSQWYCRDCLNVCI